MGLPDYRTKSGRITKGTDREEKIFEIIKILKGMSAQDIRMLMKELPLYIEDYLIVQAPTE